jgi:hypothetical protein
MRGNHHDEGFFSVFAFEGVQQRPNEGYQNHPTQQIVQMNQSGIHTVIFERI